MPKKTTASSSPSRVPASAGCKPGGSGCSTTAKSSSRPYGNTRSGGFSSACSKAMWAASTTISTAPSSARWANCAASKTGAATVPPSPSPSPPNQTNSHPRSPGKGNARTRGAQSAQPTRPNEKGPTRSPGKGNARTRGAHSGRSTTATEKGRVSRNGRSPAAHAKRGVAQPPMQSAGLHSPGALRLPGLPGHLTPRPGP